MTDSVLRTRLRKIRLVFCRDTHLYKRCFKCFIHTVINGRRFDRIRKAASSLMAQDGWEKEVEMGFSVKLLFLFFRALYSSRHQVANAHYQLRGNLQGGKMYCHRFHFLSAVPSVMEKWRHLGTQPCVQMIIPCFLCT